MEAPSAVAAEAAAVASALVAHIAGDGATRARVQAAGLALVRACRRRGVRLGAGAVPSSGTLGGASALAAGAGAAAAAAAVLGAHASGTSALAPPTLAAPPVAPSVAPAGPSLRGFVLLQEAVVNLHGRIKVLEAAAAALRALPAVYAPLEFVILWWFVDWLV